MAKYRIGDVVKSTSITPFSLKHYEKHGLIHPDSKESGYRYYDVPDIGEMLFIRQLRQYGFSVKEIQSILKKESTDAPPALYEAKIKENENLIKQLQEANDAMSEKARWQRRFTEFENKWEITDEISFAYVPHKIAGEEESSLIEIGDIIERNAHMYLAAHISRVDVPSDNADKTGWGLLTFDHTEAKSISDQYERTMMISGCECMLYYYSQPVCAYLTPDYFRSPMEDALRLHMNIQSDLFAVMIGEYSKEGKDFENYLLILPIIS